MPSKYPILKPSEIIRGLSKRGFSFVSQKGSHAKYSDGMHIVIIPMHSEIARGTLKSILEQAGMSLEEFLSNL
ncbi:MAG: type II toxin-antitoxin system HicA family toxin [Lachnospiraceae bacterium]|nr:type II toxin-antitoxin system HicA family toxin [Lachnospiraceae bacterium]